MTARDPFEELSAAIVTDDAQDPMTLSEAAHQDPIAGAPLIWRGEEIEPGAWADLGHMDHWTRLPVGCPVVPLGRIKQTFYFLNAQGEVHELKDASSGKGPIGSLFAGRSRYVEWAWPRFGKGKGGGRGPVVGWEADNARQALMDACAFVGVYDPDMTRGRGAWTDDAGKLVYHAGDRVLTVDNWKPAGRHGRFVYPGRPAIGTPWPVTVPGGRFGPAEQLRDVFERWNWRRDEIDPHLLTGWVCMSMIAGALDWRSMVFVTGEKGSGKSTLQKVLMTVFGRGMLQSVNTTGAYLYQKLGHDSIPVLVDELEAQAGGVTAKVVAIVELVRTASSGGRIGRGSSDGTARDYECRSPFICTSINIPPMRGQDQSRFAVLNLDPFAAAEADVQFDWQGLGEIGRQLLRRMVDGWPRWNATLVAFKDALIRIGGHDARGAEQFGALLAAAHLGEHDEAPTAEQLERWATALKATGLAETANKSDDWRDCLNHMLDVIPEGMRSKESAAPTLGQRLAMFRKSANNLENLEKLCTQVGLAISFEKGVEYCWANARLFVPASHPETRKLFVGTTWEGLAGAAGVWSTTLQRAPPHIAAPGVCGRGLDKKRWGILISLAAAFPDIEADDDERAI